MCLAGRPCAGSCPGRVAAPFPVVRLSFRSKVRSERSMRWQRSNPALRVLALISAVTAVSPMSLARAPPQTPLEGVTPDTGAAARDLQLEVFINETSTHLVGAFRQLPDGSLVANPDEVHDVGLKPAREALDARGMVHMDRLKGVSYRVEEAT